MNKEEAKAKIDAGEATDFVVFAEDEHKTYLENFAKSKIDETISNTTKSIHDQYDNDMKELFGKSRNQNEKTYDFLKREFTDLKDASNQSEPLRVKIKELEDALKNNAGDEQLKKELQAVRDTYKLEKDGWSLEKAGFEKDKSHTKLSNEMDKAMVGLKFKKDIPDAVRDTFIKTIKSQLISKAKMVDDKIVYMDSDGKPELNDLLGPTTTLELLSKELDSILDVENKKDGLPNPKEKIEDGKVVITVTNPMAKSQEEVTQYLIGAGMRNGTKEYNQHYAEFTKHLPALR